MSRFRAIRAVYGGSWSPPDRVFCGSWDSESLDMTLRVICLRAGSCGRRLPHCHTVTLSTLSPGRLMQVSGATFAPSFRNLCCFFTSHAGHPFIQPPTRFALGTPLVSPPRGQACELHACLHVAVPLTQMGGTHLDQRGRAPGVPRRVRAGEDGLQQVVQASYQLLHYIWTGVDPDPGLSCLIAPGQQPWRRSSW